MNVFKVTYTDGTSYETNANGTAAEFYRYLTQYGAIVDENPVTGEETRRYIATVEDVSDHNYYVTKHGNTYTASRADGKDFITSTNIQIVVRQAEAHTPKPVVTFDDASRLDFYQSI